MQIQLIHSDGRTTTHDSIKGATVNYTGTLDSIGTLVLFGSYTDKTKIEKFHRDDWVRFLVTKDLDFEG